MQLKVVRTNVLIWKLLIQEREDHNMNYTSVISLEYAPSFAFANVGALSLSTAIAHDIPTYMYHPVLAAEDIFGNVLSNQNCKDLIKAYNCPLDGNACESDK